MKSQNILLRPGDSVTVYGSNPTPAVVKDAQVPSEGRGTLGLDSYHVFLFEDGYGACQCQDYYYRAVVQGGERICKHITALKG
jgi:hypothetical protein